MKLRWWFLAVFCVGELLIHAVGLGRDWNLVFLTAVPVYLAAAVVAALEPRIGLVLLLLLVPFGPPAR